MDTKVPVDGQRADDEGFSHLIIELRQWQVIRIAAAYGVVAWLVVQVVATVGPAFDMPAWVLRAIVLAAIVGFLATMGFLLFRPRSMGKGRLPTHLSRKARLFAAAAVLLIAAAAAAYSIRSLSVSEQASLAVLPFADLSPARDKAYFAEGVAEEILSTLAAEKDIKVLGRTSASQIQRNLDPGAIRASLGVTHLLEGSTRTAGHELRVNVRLVDTSDGSQVWEEEYQGAVSDIFDVQDRIATAVVRRLRGTFFDSALRATATPTSIDAYEAYLAARALIRENKKEPMVRAFRMAQQIVEAHPDYAQGHALYADSANLLSDNPFGYGSIPVDKARAIVLTQAREAIRLAPDRADGYAAIASALPVQRRVAVYQKALVLDPSRADVRSRLGIALNLLGRNDEAFKQYRLAAETDPLSAAVINRYTQMLASSGRAKEAMQATDLFVRRGGSAAQGWRFRGNTNRLLGDESGHVAARRRALQLDPGLPYQHEWAARTLHFLGLDDQAAKYRASISPYFQLFVADDRGALRNRLIVDGARAWDSNGIESAVFSLARARDWQAILRFYDSRPADFRDLCVVQQEFAMHIAQALLSANRSSEATRLTDCMQRRISLELRAKYRGPDEAPGGLELRQASVLALRGDGRALDWLEKAMLRGWLGQYYSGRLTDWPQFDRFSADPRYAALQRRLDAAIARERAEVLASSSRMLS